MANGKVNDKTLQHGKGAVSRFEELVNSTGCGFRVAGKGDPAHAIVVFKNSTHAPKGTCSDFLRWHELVVEEKWERT